MTSANFPFVVEFIYQDPAIIFSHFCAKEGAIFLDSAQQREGCGRYSFIALEPFQILTSKNGIVTKNGVSFNANPFEVLHIELNNYPQKTLPDLPPFQGGVAGYFGYELAQHLEHLPLAKNDDMQFPDLILGFYDVILAFDLLTKRAWIFSTGFPIHDLELRQKRAQDRLNYFLSQIESISPQALPKATCQQPLPVTANFSRLAYQQQIEKAQAYILAGDIFEVNLSQRFCANLPEQLTSFDLYRNLREINPAPFAAYLYFTGTTIASASPERFLKLRNGSVEARPIKGTRRRGKSKLADEELAKGLQGSEKDRAENIMIVDLLRNDLSRVCEPHSIKVPQLCGLETYPTVHHLVSVITGKLSAQLTAIDLLKATFPGGSITGAPKISAMKIIAELEPTQRGPYCGSLGYIGFDGNMDSSIIIRTFCIKDNKISFQAGGAIVIDSEPAEEQAEVLIKANALRQVLSTNSQ